MASQDLHICRPADGRSRSLPAWFVSQTVDGLVLRSELQQLRGSQQQSGWEVGAQYGSQGRPTARAVTSLGGGARRGP